MPDKVLIVEGKPRCPHCGVDLSYDEAADSDYTVVVSFGSVLSFAEVAAPERTLVGYGGTPEPEFFCRACDLRIDPDLYEDQG